MNATNNPKETEAEKQLKIEKAKIAIRQHLGEARKLSAMMASYSGDIRFSDLAQDIYQVYGDAIHGVL